VDSEGRLKISRTESFKRDLQLLPTEIQNRAEKAIRLLAENPRHPSLRARKLRGLEDIWEASVSMSYRITYQLRNDKLTLRRIGTHDILRKEAG